MTIQKIAEGAYFVLSYSEQTIAWSPFGYTIQGLAFDETLGDIEPVQVEADEPFTKHDFEQALRKVSRRKPAQGLS